MQKTNEMRDKLIREFVENDSEKLFYFCLKKTGSTMEAEDLTQMITLQILLALNKGTIPLNFPAWIWQIARNCYSAWAKEKHVRNQSIAAFDINDYEIPDENDTLPDQMLHAEQLALLRRELAFIKSNYRDILVAYYIEDKSIREIASALSLSESAVKSRLLRARQIMKEGLEMAREFGKRSYYPEDIVYTNLCTRPGTLGQPWTLTEPKLNQNIFLACYDNPMTAEELAIEMGVALPYMEDTIRHLEAQTLLVRKGTQYETNFPIISREAMQKIHSYYEGMMPRLIANITEDIDRLMAQFEEAGLCYYGPYQSYEEAKWTLLMNSYRQLYSLCESSPTVTFGNTKRPNEGIWDVVGFEKCNVTPDDVGYHHQTNGFVHYRFGYKKIACRTPASLSPEETLTLRLMVEKKPITNPQAAERLVQYGYADKVTDHYLPRIAVISEETHRAFLRFCQKQNFRSDFAEHTKIRQQRHVAIMEEISESNHIIRGILAEELPMSIRNHPETVESLLASLCTQKALGYLVKYALACGWLQYDENTSPAIGAFMSLK